jgi:pyruvate dehydrogenase E2 component (dihydrolipoamide acetyltransferase)
MAEVIRMPLLSDTMKEGKIANWLKNVGDNVKGDDVLAEVETDKATMEVMGYADGVLLHIGVPAGSAAKVDEVIAIVGKAGEDISSYLNNNTTTNNAVAATPTSPIAESTETNNTSNTALPKELTIISMPLLSDTMKEGKIAAWLKNVGDTLKDDDVIAEVETDKATMEVIGYASGTLLYQGCQAGEAVPVNGTMAVVGPAGFDINPYLNSIKNGASTPANNADAPANPVIANTNNTPATSVITNTSITNNSNGRIKASPLAKKMAADKGINLNNIAGSGDGGRIIAKDIANANTNAMPTTNAATATSNAPSIAFAGTEGYTDTPVSQMRTIIAQRLSESMFSAPHFYLKISVQLDNLLAMRAQINNAQPVKVSINDMLIKACALALQKHPEVNSSWLGDRIRTYSHVNIGSAVAIPDGLIVPVIKHANVKPLTQIALDANELYDKAKNKKLQPAEFTGNTFTISNLGMMGIEDFIAIINPPDAAILAVGAGVPTPVVDDKGQVVVRTVMRLTLSCDHRVVDGSVGAAFLKTLKGMLENPVVMFV